MDTIVFVHGAWHGKWCWEKYFVPYFQSKGYKTHVFDLPGHEHKGKIKGINKLSIDDYVQALKHEVEKLEEPPIIIAHSMGGLVLQKFLETESCQKAVLIAPVPPSGVFKTTLRFMPFLYFYPALFGMNLYHLVNNPSKARHAFFSDNLADELLNEYTDKLCSESFLAFLNMLFPSVKMGNHLKIRQLLLAAEKDTIFSVEQNEATAKKYNADFVLMKNMAHDIMLEPKWEEAADKINEWLKV